MKLLRGIVIERGNERCGNSSCYATCNGEAEAIREKRARLIKAVAEQEARLS